MTGSVGWLRRRGDPRNCPESDAGDGADGRGERRNVVEHGQRDEVVGSAGIVLAALAGADQDAVTRGHAELADLDVGAVVVQGHFAGNGDARLVRAQVKGSGGRQVRRRVSSAANGPSCENVSSAARHRSSFVQSNMSISMKRTGPAIACATRACRGWFYGVEVRRLRGPRRRRRRPRRR
jgi:hypothetical protein